MNLTKKQILSVLLAGPIGFCFGMALRMGLGSIERELEKYNVDSFSKTDTLKIDTTFAKRGEIYTDTLVNYSMISKKEIYFKSSRDGFCSKGSLFVKNKEISRYKLLKNGLASEEVFWQNNETKTYHLNGDFIGKGFKLDGLELRVNGFKSAFGQEDSILNLPASNSQNKNYKTIYTRDTKEGKILLNNLKPEVNEYLNKIKEYKKLNGSWKD